MGSLASREGFIAAFITLIAIASGGDIVVDISHGVGNYHLIQEALLLFLAVVTLIYLGVEFRRNKRHLASLQQALQEANASPAAESPVVASARHELGAAIAKQFGLWKLTSSEQEVGMLILKGLSLKEIALVRGTAEKTIRQQASSIYQKAGVSGRHTFAAWFIEDFI